MLGLILRVLVAAVLVFFAAGMVVIGARFLLDVAARLVDPFTTPPKRGLGRGGFARFEVMVIAIATVGCIAFLCAVGGAYKLGQVVGRGELYETALNAQGRVIDLAPRVAAAQAACEDPTSSGPSVHRRTP